MLKVSAEARHNMMMAVKEALNNTVKHAAASEVNLTLSCEDRRLVVVIHDNGKGFAPEDARRFGNGLVNMRQRLESIAGEIQIRSTPGGGTNVTLSVFLSTPEK
jgi:signal transduction histidine kinase